MNTFTIHLCLFLFYFILFWEGNGHEGWATTFHDHMALMPTGNQQAKKDNSITKFSEF
jgi:hypothetical protein